MTDAGIRVVSVQDAPWDDVRTVFGTRGDPATCWCQYFKVDAATWKAGDVAAFERALCEQVPRGAGPGLLAYLDDQPVGWVAVEPRPALPRILSSRAAAPTPDPADDASVWAISCFVVRVGFRRRGVARALLAGAVEHAARHGARVLEAYPVDTAGARVSSADLYHGPLSAFEAAGFEFAGRTSESRVLVRRAL